MLENIQDSRTTNDIRAKWNKAEQLVSTGTVLFLD